MPKCSQQNPNHKKTKLRATALILCVTALCPFLMSSCQSAPGRESSKASSVKASSSAVRAKSQTEASAGDKGGQSQEKNSSAQISSSSSSRAVSSSASSEKPGNSSKAQTKAQTTTKSKTKAKNNLKSPPKVYKYATINEHLSFSDVNRSYFKDAVFIGNSLLEDLKEYTDIGGKFYCEVGLNVNTAFESKCVKVGSKKLSAMAALRQNDNFSKVYLMFGSNELGWYYPNIFIGRYKKIIAAVKAKNPDAQIYVMSIIPFTASYSAKQKEKNNERIVKFNRLLRDMCDREKTVYLDVAKALTDKSGCLPASDSFDGVHFGPKASNKWADYLLSHAVK